LTKSGLLVGTPEYMAPELISGDTVDHRVDIYSMGIVLYEMLAGTKPYSASNVAKLLFQHLEGEAVPIGQVVPGLPASVATVVHAAMARDAAARPQSARDLLAMLETELAALPTLESEPDA
jgi:serine/threonine protein kinase